MEEINTVLPQTVQTDTNKGSIDFKSVFGELELALGLNRTGARSRRYV